MSKWVNMSEVNNTLGKALESCKDELTSSFYGGAKFMLDKINEMAEEVADTPQTDLLVKPPRKSRESHEIDTSQTDCAWK